MCVINSLSCSSEKNKTCLCVFLCLFVCVLCECVIDALIQILIVMKNIQWLREVMRKVWSSWNELQSSQNIIWNFNARTVWEENVRSIGWLRRQFSEHVSQNLQELCKLAEMFQQNYITPYHQRMYVTFGRESARFSANSGRNYQDSRFLFDNLWFNKN